MVCGSNYLRLLAFCYLTLNLLWISSASTVLHQHINIDLSTYNKTDKASQVFRAYINLRQGVATIDLTNAPENCMFVIQTHSFQQNISLVQFDDEFLIGTSIGFVQANLKTSKIYTYILNYIHSPPSKVLLAIVLYEKQDPIPGGCNLTFKTKNAPYQLVTYNDNLIRVDAQAASVYNRICEANPTHLDMYHMYLYERNLNEDIHFEGINKMLTADAIKLYGTRVPEPIGHPNLRRYYSAYPGTGSVFGIIATYGNRTSAYIPAVTYACDYNNWDEDCLGPVTTEWKILCAIILFMGLFTCIFGHTFFKTQMFIFGFVFGGFISYVVASITNTLSVGQSLTISILFGFFYGIMWIVFWWKYGSPVLSVFLPVAFIGYIISCILFYTSMGDIELFQSDINYWGVFLSIIFPLTVFLLICTMFANILACSVLGASAIIIAMDHYVGGSLHYTILNNIRRATVPNFNLAVIDPPFQYRDIVLSFAWISLIVFGAFVQMKQQRGRPPFPPPPNRYLRISERTRDPVSGVRNLRVSTERTPLLG